MAADARQDVDLEEVPPDRARGRRRVAHGLVHVDRNVRVLRGHDAAQAVGRVCRGAAVDLEQGALEVGAAGAEPVRVGEAAHAPPRIGAGEHPRAGQADALPDPGEGGGRLGLAHQADAGVVLAESGAVGERRPLLAEIDLASNGGHPVAEAPVDAALRRVERGQHLPAPVRLVEVGAHHPPEEAPPPVGGEHRHHGQARGLHGDAAGHRHVEGERARRAHDRVAFAGAEEELELGDGAEALDPLRAHGDAEDGADGHQELGQAIAGDGSDVDVHGCGPDVRRLASAGVLGCWRS